MTSTLHPIPRFVFTVFEPIVDLIGFFSATLSPSYFLSSQDPITTPSPADPAALTLSPPIHILTLQFGNLLLLLALFALFILNTTTEPRVVKAYLLALAIADIGHLVGSGWVLGWERFSNLGQWNGVAWANFGIPAGLFVIRCGVLMGLFKTSEGAESADGRRKRLS